MRKGGFSASESTPPHIRPTSCSLSIGLLLMAKEENSHTEHQPTHSNVGVGLSSQAAVKLYATTAEAIANFKPTHREVISGIAPHVFDERKRRRSQRRGSSSMRAHWCNEAGGEKRSSPLRGHAWEAEHFGERPAK
jgi:hypothetical protein